MILKHSQKFKFSDRSRQLIRENPRVCKVILAAVLVAIFLLAIVIAYSIWSSSGGTATETVKSHCKEDGFEAITYTLKNSGKEDKKRIKIKFVEDTENDEYYNFEAANAECKKLAASLWEIADGQPEWEAVIQKAKKEDKSSMWLNANTSNSHCPGMRFIVGIYVTPLSFSPIRFKPL